MRVLYVVGYSLLGLACILAYVSVRQLMINTPLGLVTISNLTVNYVAASFITGGVSGWYSYNRLLRKYNYAIRLGGTACIVLVVAILWLSIMSMGGYKIRWMQ